MIKEYRDHDITHLNSFAVAARAERFVEFGSGAELAEYLGTHSDITSDKWALLGGGNNILFTGDFRGTLLHPTGTSTKITDEGTDSVGIRVEAGHDWDEFVSRCVGQGLWGVENLSHIPGTVGAAMEAALSGLPAIAVSCAAHNPVDFSAAARAALWAVDYVKQNPLPRNMVLNLNAPELPISEIKGIRLASLCLQKYENTHACFEAPGGMKYFFAPFGKLTEVSEHDDNDEKWIRDGYVTLTPIHYDITCYSYMGKMDVSGFDLTGLTIESDRFEYPGEIELRN